MKYLTPLLLEKCFNIKIVSVVAIRMHGSKCCSSSQTRHSSWFEVVH